MGKDSQFMDEFKKGYSLLFERQWPPIVGGLLLGLLVIMIEAWSRPWGIVGGIRNWADWLFYGAGLYAKRPSNPLLYSSSVMDIGLILGAFAAALLAKEFAMRMPPRLEAIKGFAGGLFMGIGSSLALGCTAGGFYTPLINLSANGFVMMIGLTFGAYLGLRYIFWELEHFPAASATYTPPPEDEAPSFDWKKVQPFMGGAVLVGLILAAKYYGRISAVETGGLLLFGAGIGIVIQRSRFCFVRAFRDPFMTGEAEVGKAIAVSIVVACVGIAVLKFNGFRYELMYVVPAFGWGGAVGGVIFGIGMVIAGGCGSGTLWRVAEGNLKLWIALFAFATSNSLMTIFNQSWGVRDTLGAAVFLPKYFGWIGGILLIIAILVVWYLILSWNEKTNKFTMEL